MKKAVKKAVKKTVKKTTVKKTVVKKTVATKKPIAKKPDVKKTNVKKETEIKQKEKQEKTKKQQAENLKRQRRLFVANLLKKEKYNDMQIAIMANDKFPVGTGNIKNAFTKGNVAGVRWHLNHGSKDLTDKPLKIEKRVINAETNENVPISQMPKATKKTNKKDPKKEALLDKYQIKKTEKTVKEV